MSDLEPSNLEGAALVQYINDLNGKVIRGEELDDDEVRRAVLALRQKRKFDSAYSPTTRKKASPAAAPLDLNALVAEHRAKGGKTPGTDADINFDFMEEKEQ